MTLASIEQSLAGDPVTAARQLLGARLRSEIDGDVVELVLTEVEAYAAEDDPASHAHRGRTKRNGSMFGPPGTVYVYRSYGMHWCLNVAAGPEGTPAAVLLRAGVPVVGEEIMARRRGRSINLADGPGKLSQALGVTGDHDGINVLTSSQLRVIPGERMDGTVLATPRVGISKGQDKPWRFVVAQLAGDVVVGE